LEILSVVFRSTVDTVSQKPISRLSERCQDLKNGQKTKRFVSFFCVLEDEQATDGKPSVTLAEVKNAVKTLGLVHNLQQWQTWKRCVLGRDIQDERLTAGQLAKLKRAIGQAKRNNQAA